MSADHLQPLLRDLREGLESLYGERLKQIILYGSHARGDATEESDVDVLVVLSGEVRPAEEVGRTGALRTRLSLDYQLLLSLFAVSSADFKTLRYPFLRNVSAEGVAL